MGEPMEAISDRVAVEAEQALRDAAAAYTEAKRTGKRKVTITTRQLYLLTIGAAHGFGVAERLAIVHRVEAPHD